MFEWLNCEATEKRKKEENMFIDFLNGMSIEEMSNKYRITRKAVGCIIDKKILKG